MLKKHTFSPNHKVVESSPHNYSPSGGSAGPGNMQSSGSGMHPSAEPMGGGAGGPEAGMQGGFADGGAPLGGGIRGKMADYGTAIKQTASDLADKARAAISGSTNPVASGNKDESYEGTGGAARNSSVDSQVEEQSK